VPTRCGVMRALAVAVIASLGLVAEASANAQPAANVLSAETVVRGDWLTVRWRVGRADVAVRVLVSDDAAAAAATMTLVGHGRGDGSLDVPRPRDGRRLYFYVAPESGGGGGVRTATRQIALGGASNFRDLGGYATRGGRHVVWGRLFRSNALSDLTADDYRIVGKLGVRLVCDLRTEPERTRQPTRWPGQSPPEFVTASDPALATRLKAALAGGTSSAATARAAMLHLYERLPEIYAAEYRRLFARLVAGATPLIVHCTAGKDRTGLAAALLLTALGVSRSVVDEDYALSATLRAAARRPDDAVVLKSRILSDGSVAPAAMAAIEASDPAYLAAALTRIVEHWGSIDAYMEQVLGVGARERALLQARYLE
jgi:protein-tyrosine phosphatase